MHHASLLIGGKEEALAYVESLFGTLKGSPDFFPWDEETFGIGEARRLSEQAIRKSFGARKIFLVRPETITPEAQNALLKTFEEPASETYFFLALREAGTVIPTLRSRMQAVFLGAAEEGSEAEEFLALPLKKRLTFAKSFAEKEKNLSAFLDALLVALRGKATRPMAMKTLFQMRLVSDQRAASARLILEHLAEVL